VTLLSMAAQLTPSEREALQEKRARTIRVYTQQR
jgi:hypothetical protein